jgi:RNA polymerase subunit RPABC4/transcription elongation factor Spt4
MAEVGSYCTHCGTKIEPSSKFCPNCGRSTSLATSGEGEGARIVKDIGGGRVAGTTEKRASAWWYLLPIFLGFIGGIVMFFVLKDEDRGRAKGGLKLGIILTAIGFALWLLIIAAIAATVPSSTTSAYYYP